MSSTLYINELQQTSHGALQKVTAGISWRDKACEVNIGWQGEPCPNPADALFLLMSSITIPQNINLSADATPSGVSTRSINRLSRGYFPTNDRPNSELASTDSRPGVQPTSEGVTKGRRQGLLFDGGIDAFHMLAQYKDEVSTLVFLNGLHGDEDQHQSSRHVLKSELQRIQYQSAELNKELLVLDTNLHDLLATLGISETLLADSFYAGLGSILGGHISDLLIPGNDKFQQPEEGFEPGMVIHDFNKLTLPEKQENMARDQYLMDALRLLGESTQNL
jgi:hypothetical protein